MSICRGLARLRAWRLETGGNISLRLDVSRSLTDQPANPLNPTQGGIATLAQYRIAPTLTFSHPSGTATLTGMACGGDAVALDSNPRACSSTHFRHSRGAPVSGAPASALPASGPGGSGTRSGCSPPRR
jgi:hypothetical protein